MANRKYTFSRDFYYPKGATIVRDRNSTAMAAIYESHGKPCAAMFGGKRNKVEPINAGGAKVYGSDHWTAYA